MINRLEFLERESKGRVDLWEESRIHFSDVTTVPENFHGLGGRIFFSLPPVEADHPRFWPLASPIKPGALRR